MANHASAKKRVRQNIKRRERNKARKSRINSYIKRLEKAIDAGEKELIMKELKSAMSEIHKGVSKGVLPSRRGDRKISRLSKRAHVVVSGTTNIQASA